MFSQNVPEFYRNMCQCYYLEKDYPGYIIMCTNTGLLLKFTENRITKRCSIKCCNAESITPFTTYNPLHKYFIIKAADLLLIISEQAQFKVVQEYQQVKDFSVGDFTGCGSPNVRIFTHNSDTPQLLTDLIKKSIEPPIVGDMVSAILRDKFQEINAKVKIAEIKLAEKRKLRMRSSLILEDIITKKSWLAYQDGHQRSKTPVVGTILVNLSDEWDRVHGSKWILGLSIKNTSNTVPVTNVKLALSCSEEGDLCYRQLLLQYASREWLPVDSVPSDTTAIMVGIIELPNFKSSLLVVSGCILFKMGEKAVSDVQLQIPSFRLTLEQTLTGSKSPFSNGQVTVADLLALSVTNERTSLVARYLNPKTKTPLHEVSLTHLLTEHIKFDTHSDLDCLFNTGQVMSGLAGILVKIVPVSDIEYRMEVYTREMSQVYLLVSTLYSLIPVNTLAVLPWVPTAPSDPHKLYKALLAEVRLMESLAPTDDTDMDYTGNIPVVEDKLMEVRQRLAALELETDLLAANL